MTAPAFSATYSTFTGYGESKWFACEQLAASYNVGTPTYWGAQYNMPDAPEGNTCELTSFTPDEGETEESGIGSWATFATVQIEAYEAPEESTGGGDMGVVAVALVIVALFFSAVAGWRQGAAA